MLEIKGLGNLTILKNGEVLDGFSSRKCDVILAYIALEGGRQSRVALAGMFWPDSSDKKAFASLRVALSSLRKFVGDYLEINRENVKIKPGTAVYLDVQDFEENIARGNLRQALELYRGDLLAGIHISGSNTFEQWRRWEQERLSLMLISALQESITANLAQGDYKKGQALAAELLKLDPFNETAHQQYMVSLAASGKRTAALKHYKQCRKIMMEELGVEPSVETEELIDRISQGEHGSLVQLVQPKNNLSPPQTSFIGREKDTAKVASLLKDESCRLLTLTGPGGVGKTRLAQNVAKRALEQFADGVFFIPLEGVPTPDFIVPAIAEVLQFKFDQLTFRSDPIGQMINYLDHRSILIILDGFEHLIEGRDILLNLLKRTIGVKILLTSRQKLGMRSEWVYQVSGLPIPESADNAGDEAGNSLGLFIERARHVNQGAVLSGEEMNAALQICQLVEGFPLGIELAAAWTAVLGYAEIVEEIKKSLRFLTSPIQGFSERHQSLEAAFNYSWQMLEEDQRKILARLSVFCGGFNRHSAKWIADADLMKLNELLDRSLLQRLNDGRIGIHRLIHQFADEKLKESPDTWHEVHDLHSHYFIAFLQEREDDLDGGKMIVTREDIRKELENLHAAMAWAVQHWEADAATEAVRSYSSFYLVHGWYEGVVAFDQLAAMIQINKAVPILDDVTYLSCRAHQAWFCTNLGMAEEGENISMECLTPLQELGMDRELALCLHNLGVCAMVRGEYQRSRELLEEAIALGKTDPFVAFRTFYLWLGYVEYLLGEYESGMRSFKTSYTLFNERGDSWGMSYALGKMGLAADGLGDYESAMVYEHEAYQIFLETGDIIGQGYTLSRLSMGSYFLEEYDEALALGEQALEIFRDINHCWGVCTSQCRLGFAYLGKGLTREANVKFHDALNRAWESQLVPISLAALAGIASAMMFKKKKKEGWELFNYVQLHPKTPAIYIDVASRWFRVGKRSYSLIKDSEDEMVPLAEIIEAVKE